MMCEICGSRASRLRRVVVEGSIMSVCPGCFNTLTRKIPVEGGYAERVAIRKEGKKDKPVMRKAEKKAGKPEESLGIELMELVDNYGDLIRRRMRELGWSEEELGARTGLKTSLVRKIEAGKITPSIQDARKIEDALKIRLLKPGSKLQELASAGYRTKPPPSITLGDVLRRESSG
jgi:putative transcription factor